MIKTAVLPYKDKHGKECYNCQAMKHGNSVYITCNDNACKECVSVVHCIGEGLVSRRSGSRSYQVCPFVSFGGLTNFTTWNESWFSNNRL